MKKRYVKIFSYTEENYERPQLALNCEFYEDEKLMGNVAPFDPENENNLIWQWLCSDIAIKDLMNIE